MRAKTLLLLLMLVAVPTAADALGPVEGPTHTQRDCLGGSNEWRCVAMVNYCLYFLMANGDVDTCLLVID